MFALERHKRILELLERDGSVRVSDLSAEFGIAEETVRRDLEKLESQEALLRTHGGAVLIDENNYELSLEKRKKTNSVSKDLLAKKAAEHVFPGDTIFLDASTTTFCMAKYIKKIGNVTVITNSVRVVNELSGSDRIKVICIGGRLSDNQSFIGNVAESIIEKCYFAGKVFFSSKGVCADRGILESNEYECSIKKKMLEHSRQKFYLCDKSKIGRVGFNKLAPINMVDYFITDEANLDEEFMAMFAENDTVYEVV